MMNVVHSKILSIVKNSIQDVKNSIQDIDVNKMSDSVNINTDYSQLEALSKKDIAKYN